MFQMNPYIKQQNNPMNLLMQMLQHNPNLMASLQQNKDKTIGQLLEEYKIKV